jgi:hypothetical protein
MGYNSDQTKLPICVDLETTAHPCVADFVEAPNLDAITPARNLRDPQKIAEDIARRQAEAKTEFEQKLERASLDFNLSRIVALGWSEDAGQTVELRACPDEETERAALEIFWNASHGATLIGFSLRTFDVPMLIQRSRLLSVSYNRLDLSRYNNRSLVDLRDELTFGDMRYEAIMPRSLKMFCRRFGLPVDDPIDGKDIPALVAAEAWDDVLAHLRSDVQLTAALAKRLGYLYAHEPAGVF